MNSLNDVNVPNVQCKQYLIDGEITNWTGPSADVFSNIYLSKFLAQRFKSAFG